MSMTCMMWRRPWQLHLQRPLGMNIAAAISSKTCKHPISQFGRAADVRTAATVDHTFSIRQLPPRYYAVGGRWMCSASGNDSGKKIQWGPSFKQTVKQESMPKRDGGLILDRHDVSTSGTTFSGTYLNERGANGNEKHGMQIPKQIRIDCETIDATSQ